LAVTIRTVLILVLALVSGACAALGVTLMVNQDQIAFGAETVPVVVAADNYPRGFIVTADMVKTREWPKDLLPPDAVTKVQDALQRAALHPLMKDEPLYHSRLAKKGTGTGMAVTIPIGKRAFTILTPNVAAGVAGFILPGNKVDVLLTITGFSGQDNTGGGTTITLLQNLEILAVDERRETPVNNKFDSKEMRSVTLLVTPDEAAKLDLSQNKGILHLALRHPLDADKASTRAVTMRDLPFEQEKPAVNMAKVMENVAKLMVPAVAKAQVPQPPAQINIRRIEGTTERMETRRRDSWELIR
jgi:pilus assembly protein CpaB